MLTAVRLASARNTPAVSLAATAASRHLATKTSDPNKVRIPKNNRTAGALGQFALDYLEHLDLTKSPRALLSEINNAWLGQEEETRKSYAVRASKVPKGDFFYSFSNIVKKAEELVKDEKTKLLAKAAKAKKPAQPRAVSSFILYSQERFQTLRGENPGIPVSGIMKIVGQEWKALDATKKDQYKAKYEQAKAALKADAAAAPAQPSS